MNAAANMWIHLSFIKPNITEIFKNVKQMPTLHYDALENVFFS